jgi:hypothetical protein
MNEPFTAEEAASLRDLFLRKDNPTDDDFLRIRSRPIAEFRYIARHDSAVLRDRQVPIDQLVTVLNASVNPSPRSTRPVPPRIDTSPSRAVEPIFSATYAALPPKIRGKAMARTPAVSIPPPAFLQTSPSAAIDGPFGTSAKIFPLLPKIADSQASVVAAYRKQTRPPPIGSLAAVLHPHLGPAHVCRVLGEQSKNDSDYVLIAFFQSEHSPCLVPREYLFQLEPHPGLPLYNDEEFSRCLVAREVSVDWILERVFSAAQNLAINSAEVLFPEEQVREAPTKPTAQQIQQIMFQCVSYAALLIVCYLGARWAIPYPKLEVIIATALQTNPPKFVSTQTALGHVQQLVAELLTLSRTAR